MIHYGCHSSFQDHLIGGVRKLLPFKPEITGTSSFNRPTCLSWEIAWLQLHSCIEDFYRMKSNSQLYTWTQIISCKRLNTAHRQGLIVSFALRDILRGGWNTKKFPQDYKKPHSFHIHKKSMVYYIKQFNIIEQRSCFINVTKYKSVMSQA